MHIFQHHTTTCSPSKDQLVMVRTAAGNYVKFTDLILKDLIKLIGLNCLICELLQRPLPNRKYISSDDVCNARVRVKPLMKQIKKMVIQLTHSNIIKTWLWVFREA